MKFNENIKVLFEDLNEKDHNSLIKKCVEIRHIKKELESTEVKLKNKLKTFLKKRHWNKYVDKESKTSITLLKQTHETFDESKLKILLNESQLAQIKKITTIEKLLIITPEDRVRLKEYGKTNI